MSSTRGGSYGGGRSSLGYLFSSDEQPSQAPSSLTVIKAPWDDDNTTNKPPINSSSSSISSSSKKLPVSNNYHRSQGQNSDNFITDRPTTKVQSAPGGDSSLGYLFGGKK